MCKSDKKSNPVRVAVIGSGMAGLSAAWLLGQDERFQVHMYETQTEPGLGAHSVAVTNPETGQDVYVDIPLRIVAPSYYPELVALYRTLGVELYTADSSSSLSLPHSNLAYFRYFNIVLGRRALPLTMLRNCVSGDFWRIARDFCYFSYAACRDFHNGTMKNITIGEYLSANKYSDAFIHYCIVPYFAVICTCSHEAVLAYPATVIVEYLLPILASPAGVRRVSEGVKLVGKQMTEKLHNLKCNVAVKNIEHLEDGTLVVSDSTGESTIFDHVILCTQANDASRLTKDCHPELSKCLSEIRHDRSETILHTDATLMPRNKADWSPMNLFVSAKETICTCWIVKLQPSVGDQDVFQTWYQSSTKSPAADTVIARSSFERPVVTLETESLLRKVADLQGQRNIWVCGAYSLQGIPLLENAASSGLSVAEQIGCRPRPWGTTKKDTVPPPSDIVYVLIWTLLLAFASCIASMLSFLRFVEL